MVEGTRLLGLVGGISWASTKEYYRALNEGVQRKLGGLHAARHLIDSIDFHDFVTANTAGRFDLTLELMQAACRRLAAAGVEGIMRCANTAHAVIGPLKSEFNLRFIDIIEHTAAAISLLGLRKVALIGTQFTMELPFYVDAMQGYGIEAIVPPLQADREYIQFTVKMNWAAALRGHRRIMLI